MKMQIQQTKLVLISFLLSLSACTDIFNVTPDEVLAQPTEKIVGTYDINLIENGTQRYHYPGYVYFTIDKRSINPLGAKFQIKGYTGVLVGLSPMCEYEVGNETICVDEPNGYRTIELKSSTTAAITELWERKQGEKDKKIGFLKDQTLTLEMDINGKSSLITGKKRF